VQRDLRALADRAEEQEQRDHGDHCAAVRERGRRSLEDRHEVEAAQVGENEEHGDQEAEVADAIDDERLLARVRLLAVTEPEADEQVAAQPDALPAHEHDGEVRAEDQHQHEEHEQVQVREVARVARILVHVADAEYVDQQADARYDHGHQHGQLVELERGVDAEAADRHPLPVRLDDGFVQVRAEHPDEVDQGQHEGERDDARPDDRRYDLAGRRRERGRAIDGEAEQGQQRDRPQERWMKIVHATTAAG
jgi:hypothetical protein